MVFTLGGMPMSGKGPNKVLTGTSPTVGNTKGN